MDCKAVQERLSACLDGRLTADEIGQVAAHLDDCPACQAELSSLERTVELVRSLEPVEPPAELTARIMARVNELKTSQDKAPRRGPEFFRRAWRQAALRPVYGAAVAAVLILAVVLGRGALDKGLSSVGPEVLMTMQSAAREEEMTGALPPQASEQQVLDMGAAPQAEVVPREQPAMKAADRLLRPNKAEAPAAESLDRLDRMVIQTAHLVLRVEDLDAAAQELTRLVQGRGGFIQNSNLRRGDSWRSANYTLRVPAPVFEDVLGQVQELGEAEQRSISGQDVTEEYLDVDARRRNLERQEQRLLDILDQAKTVDDILKVESQLERVRGEIEVLTGRLKYLNDRVTLSTLEVELSERPQPVSTVRSFSFSALGGRLRQTVTASINTLLDYMAKGLVALAAGLPFLLSALVVFGIGWWLFRRFGKRP